MHAVFVLTLLVAVAAGQKYITKYDGIDIEEVIKNDRLFNGYYNCILGKSQCTPDGEELKRNIPDALETNCSKCSEKQKAGAKKIMRYLFEKKQAQYKELEAKYDPQGKYRKYFERFIKA